MPNEVDLLALDGSSVTAPAGCGKTNSIVQALKRGKGEKPILVLTHTNAGVAALRQRLHREGVEQRKFRLVTIDGWCLRLAAMFPKRSGVLSETLRLGNPRSDYPEIRESVVGLLSSEDIADSLRASYSHLLVDEYQDCSLLQHAVVSHAARVVPTCVLGDPLQAIFGFGGDDLADWQSDVLARFPVAAELSTPWRWVNVGEAALGEWLLSIRKNLLDREPIDLGSAPSSVSWVHLDGIDDHKKYLSAGQSRPPNLSGSVLVIADSKNPERQRLFASQISGAITVEAVELKDLVAFANGWNMAAPTALRSLLLFSTNIMNGIGVTDLLRRLSSLRAGTARNPASVVELAALRFDDSRTAEAAAELLEALGAEPGTRTYRPAIARAVMRALRRVQLSGCSFFEAVIEQREEQRVIGRAIPTRAVGSTLLVKGLEADVAVVLDADSFNAANLYVALTRGARRVVVCSRSAVLRAK